MDILRLADLDYHQVWLSRRRDHLELNIAGSTDRVLIKDWYVKAESQLDAIYTGGHVLMRDQGDRLVSAMAGFDGPRLLYTSPSPPDRNRSRMPSFSLKKKKKIRHQKHSSGDIGCDCITVHDTTSTLL